MRELALHILDLIENSIRAPATVIALTISADPEQDRLRIVIEDNGPGLKVTPAQALDPFYTTKPGKRTGLGLPLFRSAAEQAGGGLRLERSFLGGLRVIADFRLHHVDRNPLGDLAGTLSGLVVTNPDIDFRFRIGCGDRCDELNVQELAHPKDGNGCSPFALAQQVGTLIRAAVLRLESSSGMTL